MHQAGYLQLFVDVSVQIVHCSILSYEFLPLISVDQGVRAQLISKSLPDLQTRRKM